MPEAKRPDPRRRSGGDSRSKKAPASRPARPGKAGDAGRAKPRGTSSRRETRSADGNGKELAKVTEDPGSSQFDDAEADTSKAVSLRNSIVASAELAAEQRFGSTARRAAVLAAVVCVLTLTIAGPVRTYFAQRTEMKQLEASEVVLRQQIADLEAQKAKLADPVFIAAQARERLGFVMPGEIPYQVQLPAGATESGGTPAGQPAQVKSGDPWYTALWHTIADNPHGISPAPPPPPPGAAVAPEPAGPGAPPPGG